MNFLNPFELGLLDAMSEALQCAFLDRLMPLITMFGEYGLFWIAVAAVLLCVPKTRRLGLTMGISFALGLLIGNGILKNAVARIRPYDMEGARFTAEQLLVRMTGDFSFPSGHTLVCVEAASVLTLRRCGLWAWGAWGIAVLVMLSRMYLYVHYPTDILGGAVLGVLMALCAILIEKRLHALIEARLKQKKTE